MISALFKRAVAFGACALLLQPVNAGDEGYRTLSSSGSNVLQSCNPDNSAYCDRCRVKSLPGASGFSQVASRSSDIVKNDVVIGTLYERVWRSSNGQVIFGSRIVLNDSPYNLSGLSFNANDLMRQVLASKGVDIAYYMPGDPAKAVKYAGRTVQGLNEYDTVQPARDNGWVDFGIDTNAAEPSGPSAAGSPWLLARTTAPAGYSVQPFAIRILNSDVQDLSEATEIFLSGYQPN